YVALEGCAVVPGEAAAGGADGVLAAVGVGLPAVVGAVLDEAAAAVHARLGVAVGGEAGDPPGSVADGADVLAVPVEAGGVGVGRGPHVPGLEEGDGVFAVGWSAGVGGPADGPGEELVVHVLGVADAAGGSGCAVHADEGEGHGGALGVAVAFVPP